MKKVLMALSIVIVASSAVYADGNAFTPLNFNDTSYQGNASTTAITSIDEASGNGSIQNAISQLDNAQVDIRNDLLNYKTRFADVDAQYKLVKNERNALKKQIKSVEKRIKELDKAKEHIKKNMI